MTQTTDLGTPAAVEDMLLLRISRLLSTGGGMVIRLCEGRFGITRREWRVIGLLATLPPGEGLRPSDLAVRAQLDRARTSRALSSLAAKQLVSRDAMPGDRRQAGVKLTERGRALHGELFPLVKEINLDLLAGLSPQEVLALDGMLTRMQARAERLAAATQDELPKADRRRGRAG